MKYLEIIKEYEKHNETMKKNGFVVRPENNRSVFLLKAFKVMKQIAVDYADTREIYTTPSKSKIFIEKEFEKRMKNNP